MLTTEQILLLIELVRERSATLHRPINPASRLASDQDLRELQATLSIMLQMAEAREYAMREWAREGGLK